ncbi:MAG TPA: DUF58 domain-containing protein [Novimethylophilus sp.]|jgi:uncharacterized protein (DUF58 family)|uniref:DUF58 domain-containing protein n=1 Tax=Novimethylophilus sp. TaxID=2137426 RepID=UPI002F40AC25
MSFFQAKEFSYHIGWRSRGRHAGRHASVQTGLGMEFRGHAPLIAYPDPRRIDLRQTLRDPSEQIFVRMFNQKSSIPVYALCDLSGSMGFVGERSKLALAAEIAASVAYSAYRVSDPFGFVGFDDMVREDWLFTSTTKVHGAFDLTDRLGDYRPSGGANGLLDADRFLSRERSLVFLISDFHMPSALLEQALGSLMRHHVVPVVLWDGAEYRKLPEFGITSVTDCETGARRTLFLRKGYRERIAQAFEDRRQMLQKLFMRFDMPPFFVEETFSADALTEYFYQFVAA